ncbi:RHS repeat-associated core domain-containing protein [Pseudomonas koreensis]|uniref:RHS repeat-associated core domain-containing protein n=1 Tax=Pseudomonas koreensis TaxID=198620 RepID=UPI00320A4A11
MTKVNSTSNDPAFLIDLNTRGFNGQIFDSVSRTYLLGNGYRSYSPALRTFNSRDSLSPFGAGGINRYQYCNQDPINYSDPSGHFPVAIISMVAIAISIGLSISSLGTGLAAYSYRDSDPEYAQKLRDVTFYLDIAAIAFGVIGTGMSFRAGQIAKTMVSQSKTMAYFNARTGTTMFRNTARQFVQNSRIAGAGANLNYQSSFQALIMGIMARASTINPMVKAGMVGTAAGSGLLVANKAVNSAATKTPSATPPIP